MIVQWRLFVAALRFVTHRPIAGAGDANGVPPRGTARFVPLVGIVVGMAGAGVYGVAAGIWPTSVAVVLSMLATVVATANFNGDAHLGRGPLSSSAKRAIDSGVSNATGPGVSNTRLGTPYWVFVLLIKYNALMALSAATGPFPLPAYFTLGLIMIAGHAASRALVVSVMATDADHAGRVTSQDLGIALGLGLAPATLFGIPGLIGLVSAIVVRLVLTAGVFLRLGCGFRERLEVTQQLTEAGFYLGALATWKYV